MGAKLKVAGWLALGAVAGALTAMIALQNGAKIIRTHDVAETRDAIRVWRALEALGKDVCSE